MTESDHINSGLRQKDVLDLQKRYGFNEIIERKPRYIVLFLSKFWGLSAWMLEAIIVLSFFLHKISDAYLVLGLLFFNSVIGYIQERNAAKAVELLKKKLEINVKVLRDTIWKTLPARELVPGDVIRVRIGDFIPADLEIGEGEISVDQSALTGESASIEKKQSDPVYSGSIVVKGEATCVVTVIGEKTFFGKTVQLVQTAKPKFHIEKTITGVVKWLLWIVGVFLGIAFIVGLVKGTALFSMLPLMLVLLLGAIPVALTAMFTVSMALGSKELIKQGVLITRLNAPDDAAAMEILCVDKTGTLTTNRLSVAEIIPYKNHNKQETLLYGALASKESNHDPIDSAFIGYAKENHIINTPYLLKSFKPFDPELRRTEALIQGTNEEFIVMKGSVNSIASECGLIAVEIEALELQIGKLAKSGYRTLAIAKGQSNNKPEFIGLVALHDPPRKDSADLIREIEGVGVSVKMLTGDALPIAREIARQVKVGDKILKSDQLKEATPAVLADLIQKNTGVAEVYPEDKFKIVKALQAEGIIVGMTGDGVNDAPALKQAEVGIAVSSATDVAKSAASIVLTREGLVSVLEPIKVGRKMFERINIWVLNKIARTILKTTFVVGAFLVLGKFVISASAMLIMIFLTDFVKISLATDNVKWENIPSKWNLKGLAKTGIIVGLLMSIEAFALLYLGWTYFGLSDNDRKLSTFCFELLLFFALFSIFVVREKRHFWQSMPSKILLFIVFGDIVLGFLVASFGLLGFNSIPFSLSLLVLGYALICSLGINDFIKFILLRRVRK